MIIIFSWRAEDFRPVIWNLTATRLNLQPVSKSLLCETVFIHEKNQERLWYMCDSASYTGIQNQ